MTLRPKSNTIRKYKFDDDSSHAILEGSYITSSSNTVFRCSSNTSSSKRDDQEIEESIIRKLKENK